ncbi:MAG TPA: LysR family transcriptional regulator [Acidimicrobiales bacterium]|nr:LysR family transcriptional regulator [Acidimicrobiales bacterium]
MSSSEWLRTFVAIYRSGSVTDGAALRSLSQPAASQQLRSLERSVGAPLFVRTPHGVEPTRRGRDLYVDVADSLDRLEPVLAGLDGGTLRPDAPALRFGSSPEYCSYAVVPRTVPGAEPLSVRFGTDAELLDLLRQGELDVAVTTTDPGRRGLAGRPLGSTRFVLVAAPDHRPEVTGTLAALAGDLAGTPWVAYSAELPRTRRFWQATLGRTFAGDLRLVAPDLRSVAGAVARGIGSSLLPAYACADGLAVGTLVEVFPVADLVPPEPWFASTREADLVRPQVLRFTQALALPGTG